MTPWSRRPALAGLLLLLFSGLSVGAPPAEPTHADEIFPELEGLVPNVEFWIRVFGEWNRGQVAIHDLQHPQLIYEVLELRGPIEERYTAEQTDDVVAIRESWERYLEQLERKVAAREPLDDVEKKWALYITDLLGTDGLAGAHERVRSQRGIRERFREGLERSQRFETAMRSIFHEAGLPGDLAYLPHVESSFQYNATSSAGASGIWQFTRSTGRRFMSINSAIDERLDPIRATYAAAAYLREAYEELGSWPLALTSYNHGLGGMQRAKQQFGTDFERIVREYRGRSFGFASRNFYAEFLAARYVATHADRYFPEGYDAEPAFDFDDLILEQHTTPGSIAKRFGLPVSALAEINPAWSDRAVSAPLKLPAGTRVWLPPGTLGSRGTGSADLGPAEPKGWIDDGGLYVVQPGDTLLEIGRAHGISVVTLSALNGLPATSSLIHVGQKLRIRTDPFGAPQESGARHVVRYGETLGRIAAEYGIRLTDLLSVNMLTTRSIIRPGQSLYIPD